MEARKQTATIQHTAASEHDRSWQIVKRWPVVRAENKLAWRFLWLRSNGGREQIAVKAVELGADQNTSDDAGARYLRTLATEGLIEVTDLGRGVKLVTVLDPLDVAKARRACGGDSQTLFAFLEEVEEGGGAEYPPAVVGFEPAAVPPAEPRRPTDPATAVPRLPTAVPPSEPRSSSAEPRSIAAEVRSLTAVPPSEPRSDRGSTRGTAAAATPLRGKGVSQCASLTKDKDKDKYKDLSKTKTSTTLESLSTIDSALRGTAATTIASVLAELPAIDDGSGFAAALERTKARIRDAVRDPAAEPVVIALAHAHADGRVKGLEIDRMLSRLAGGVDAGGMPIGNRGGFFRRQVLFKFRDLGIRAEDYLPTKPKPR